MKRSRISVQRRRFERQALRRLKEAGATPGELARCRWLLVQGRKDNGDTLAEAMNKASGERFGLELMECFFRGEPPPIVAVRLNPSPTLTLHG